MITNQEYHKSGMPFELFYKDPTTQELSRSALNHTLVIGRAPECHLVIHDQRLSRRHAELRPDEGNPGRAPSESLFWLSDLGTPNGTWLNGNKIRRASIRIGDKFKLGKTEFTLVYNSSLKNIAEQQISTPTETTVETRPKEIPEEEQIHFRLETSKAPGLDQHPSSFIFQTHGVGDDLLDSHSNQDLLHLLRTARHFVVVQEILRILSKQSELEIAFPKILSALINVIPAESARIGMFPFQGDKTDCLPKKEDLQWTSIYSPSALHYSTSESSFSWSTSLFQSVVVERTALFSSHLEKDARFQGAQSLMSRGVRALLSAPILIVNADEKFRVLGVLELESRTPKNWDEQDLALLQLIASALGGPIEQLRISEERARALSQLKAAEAQLLISEKRATIGQLASGIAHEIRNHLSPFTLTDLLRKKIKGDKDAEDVLDLMKEAYEQVLDLISEFKGLGSETSSTLEKEPTDLAELVARTFRLMRADERFRQIGFTLDIQCEPILEINPRSIRQILVNLLRNAADAIQGVQGLQKNGNIVLRLSELDGFAHIDVEDDGPGIPPPIRAHIFDPFFTTKKEYGMGLGLDISKRLSEAHDGKLSFEDLTKGTRFRLSLPSSSLRSRRDNQDK